MLKPKTILISAILIFLLIVGSIVYLLVFKKPVESPPVPEEKTLEEKLQSLTAPARATSAVPEGVIENLTAPGGGEEVSEDIIQKLTAPE